MSVKSKIQSLISAANNVTGAQADNLTDSIRALVDGYGKGGEAEPLYVTQNGTYTAEEGKAFNPVEVNVPNPSAGSISIRKNGTYDVTEKASAIVYVSEGVKSELLSVTQNGTYTAEEGKAFNLVEVNVSGSSVVAVKHGVRFIDYDGSAVATWGSSEVASKTALPDNPTHQGLVAQGWNWSLDSIKSYISKYPNALVTVGQMYKTASGLTEIDISVTPVTGKTVTCKMSGKKNWGDGTDQDSATSHTYADYGKYTIVCDGTSIPAGTSNSSMFGSDQYVCINIRIGERVNSIGSYAFNFCYDLISVTIPVRVTSLAQYMFQSCYCLKSVVIPDSVTHIYSYAFNTCRALTSVAIPASVTNIGARTFYNCYSLSNVAIPDGVTKIDQYMFNSCYNLTSVVVPTSVTKIDAYAFSNCCNLIECDISSATAFTNGATSFESINGTCKILVPSELYDDWVVNPNWSKYINYIYPV